ncbi:LytTR family transcriptional regulator [Spirosoma sp. KCTC 42546]|uniref:LytR/AlgR family response regulator transcription factor n=1 Tax=Spirosoma sp. KCTC 42546 TaxID=2520506 RepID=UPI0011576D8A|nr:LytTR family DNA-binding domain-containing protein [Spirosoma sp. KCTC 42546]QDK79985.1 LytTR family transcriptional regulator [Spirosoma sp. KCTC 42546]
MKRLAAAQLQHKFDPNQVLYLTGDVNYCSVHLLNGKAILSSRTLKWYNDRWPHFIRIHKANLINPQHIHSCIVVSSIVAHLIMRNGARLPIGRRRISAVVDQLGIELPKNSYTGSYQAKPEWRDYVQPHSKAA